MPDGLPMNEMRRNDDAINNKCPYQKNVILKKMAFNAILNAYLILSSLFVTFNLHNIYSQFLFMLVKTFGSAVYGVEAINITIEVNVSEGQGYFLVGLPDGAVKESQQRIDSAIKSNGFRMPRIKIVVNMAPADIKKSGSAFDLPIAIGILGASEQIENARGFERLCDNGRAKSRWCHTAYKRSFAYCHTGT